MAFAWMVGREGSQRGMTTFGDDGNGHYLDCGDGSTHIYVCIYTYIYTFKT